MKEAAGRSGSLSFAYPWRGEKALPYKPWDTLGGDGTEGDRPRGRRSRLATAARRPGGPADAEGASFAAHFAGKPQAVKCAAGSSVVLSPVDGTRLGYFMEIAKRIAASPEGSG